MREGKILLTSPQRKFTVIADQSGGHISSIVRTACQTEFLLRTPWEDEHWAGQFAAGNSSEEWHRRYPGGWHTLIPHAGDARQLDGVEHPFHGEAAWRHWRIVDQEEHSCTFEVVLRTVPFRVRRRIEATDSGVRVEQSVQNISAAAVLFSWTEHPAFGDALIGPNSTLTISGEPLAADFSRSGFQTLKVNGRGVAEIRNEDNGYLARLSWNPVLMPYVYIWQEHGESVGFPWWGSTNTVGIEPASRPYHHDESCLGPITLDGGNTMTARFDLELGTL
jgi:galactose mutarotase-like enzyme